jgi:hypothetical protein
MNIVDVNEANQGNKNVDFLLMNMTRSCNDLHQVLAKSKDWIAK